MCIRDSLQSDFKLLLGYGRDAASLYDGGIRRSVRFVDKEYGLCLNICLPGTDTWITITPSQALETRKKKIELEESRMRSAMGSINTGIGGNVGINLSKATMSKSFVGQRPRQTAAATGANRTPMGAGSSKDAGARGGGSSQQTHQGDAVEDDKEEEMESF